jgi:hypothetical protein
MVRTRSTVFVTVNSETNQNTILDANGPEEIIPHLQGAVVSHAAAAIAALAADNSTACFTALLTCCRTALCGI